MPPSPLPSRPLRTHRSLVPALALAILSIASLGADVSPCGSPRRHVRPDPTPPATSEPSAEQIRACCQKCAAAATRDPSGIDLRVQPCSKYRGPQPDGSPGLDESCADLLTDRKLTIGACQQQTATQ